MRYTSTGNTTVQGWVVKPPGFDPTKKYPLIMEIHGGPHGMYNVGFNYQFQNFAANGYVVLYTNPRGSTGYGSAFGNAIKHAYPSVDYDDLMAGVNAVVNKGYVDTTRMYVGGCSGGGVLSSWVIGHTNRFAGAAVRCPVINWMSFAGQTDVPLFTYNFFEKPFWEKPEQWLKQSPLMYVGNVTTPTLLMTGELDLRTPMPQTEEYYAALKMRGDADGAAALRGRVPRDELEAVELHAHAALHDELVQEVETDRHLRHDGHGIGPIIPSERPASRGIAVVLTAGRP